MNKIFSKVDTTKLVCSWICLDEVNMYRTDMGPHTEFLQVSARSLQKDIHVKAHQHKPICRKIDSTQEAWVVFRGKIKAKIYDLDKTFLDEVIINDGGCLVLYHGGHSLTCLEENTIFYEIKTGPYYGYENDKENI